jgi:hypothetical protein
MMQLLSLLTMMLPTVSNVKLARQAWVLTWILADFSAACSIVAIPIYLKFPVEWSSTISLHWCSGVRICSFAICI